MSITAVISNEGTFPAAASHAEIQSQTNGCYVIKDQDGNGNTAENYRLSVRLPP